MNRLGALRQPGPSGLVVLDSRRDTGKLATLLADDVGRLRNFLDVDFDGWGIA